MSSVVIRNDASDSKTVTQITQKQIKMHLGLVRRLKASASMLLNSLKLGATVEDGDGTAFLDLGSTKKPNWRAALLKAVGEDALAKVRDATPLKNHCRLRVELAKPATK